MKEQYSSFILVISLTIKFRLFGSEKVFCFLFEKITYHDNIINFRYTTNKNVDIYDCRTI